MVRAGPLEIGLGPRGRRSAARVLDLPERPVAPGVLALETSMHCVDAAAAAGWETSIPGAFAVDGIDELLDGFLARPKGNWWPTLRSPSQSGRPTPRTPGRFV